MERLALALIHLTRKLQHYFLADPVVVFTNHLMKQILWRLDVSGRLVKWVVELTQFDILYQPCTTVKGQALAEFNAELIFPLEEDMDGNMKHLKWTLYVNGASNEGGSRAGLMLISPENHRINSAFRFSFVASNIEAVYEALQAGFRLAKELQVDSLQIFSTSKLIVEQVYGEFQVRYERMVA